MRRILNCINKAEGTHALGPTDNGLDIVDRAHRIAGITNRHQLGPFVDQRAQMLHIKRTGFHIHIGPTHLCPGILSQPQPGGDIGIVVEAGNNDLVARF